MAAWQEPPFDCLQSATDKINNLKVYICVHNIFKFTLESKNAEIFLRPILFINRLVDAIGWQLWLEDAIGWQVWLVDATGWQVWLADAIGWQVWLADAIG